MQINSYDKRCNQPSFEKFIKITGSDHKINHFRTKLNSQTDKFLTLKINKKEHKTILYLFSGKDADKYIDLAIKYQPYNVRNNVKKYMAKNPISMKVEKALSKLKTNYFSKKK